MSDSDLIQALHDPSVVVRLNAIETAHKTRDLSVVPVLIEIAKRNAFEAHAAIAALGAIGDRSAMPVLLELNDHGDYDTRETAIRALGDIGDSAAAPALLSALKFRYLGRDGAKQARYVRMAAAEALGKIGCAEAVPQLMIALRDREEGVRFCAASALGKIGDRSAIPVLTNALLDRYEFTRQAAAQALCKMPDPSAVPILIKALRREIGRYSGIVSELLGRVNEFKGSELGEPDIADSIAVALCTIGSPTAISAILQVLRCRYADVRASAAKALGSVRGVPDVVPALIAALHDKSDRVRCSATTSLGKIGDVSAVPVLIGILQNPQSLCRFEAASALGRIGGVSAVTALVRMVNDEDSRMRGVVVCALGENGHASIFPALADEAGTVRCTAAWVLGEFGDPSAIPYLIEALTNSNEGDTYFRDNSAKALGKIGDVSCLEKLHAIVEANPEAHLAISLAIQELNAKFAKDIPVGSDTEI